MNHLTPIQFFKFFVNQQLNENVNKFLKIEKKKCYICCKMHFGFISLGSEMHRSRVTARNIAQEKAILRTV